MGRYSGKRCRLMSMFMLTTSFFFVEIIVGYITNSVALVADSFHMLSDVIALIIAFLSVQMSPKKWSKNTFGWARAEVLGALVNAVFLVALCFSIFVEALKRLYDVDEIHNPKLILYVGCGGLLVNIIGLFLFHEHGHGHSHRRAHHRSLPTIEEVLAEEDINENHENYRLSDNLPNTGQDGHGHGRQMASGSQMNMRGVFLHVLADALGSVIVIISALIIWLTDWEYRFHVDPALSIIMVILIMKSTWPLLVESALILLQTVPTHIQVDNLQKKLLQEVKVRPGGGCTNHPLIGLMVKIQGLVKTQFTYKNATGLPSHILVENICKPDFSGWLIDGVLAVHEFHVWQLAGERIIASAHIRCRNPVDYMQIAEKVKEFFHNEGIHSTTIQPEFVDIPTTYQEKDENCILDCPASTNCTAQTCCGPQKEGHLTPVCRQRLNNGGNNAENFPDDVTLALESGDINDLSKNT